jgi:hypothetical protein
MPICPLLARPGELPALRAYGARIRYLPRPSSAPICIRAESTRNGKIDPPQLPKNFLELGARYLCQEKHTVTQHFCAIRPGGSVADKASPFTGLVVVAVAGAATYTSLATPAELQATLVELVRRCFIAVTGKVVPASDVVLQRVAISGYSRSGVLLRQLLTDPDQPFIRDTVKEVYAYDVMFEEVDKDGNVTKSRKQGYAEFWAKLVAWQGSDADRRIRLYSAEPDTVAGIYTELQDRLRRYGGGYHNPAARFSQFNGGSSPTSVTGTRSTRPTTPAHWWCCRRATRCSTWNSRRRTSPTRTASRWAAPSSRACRGTAGSWPGSSHTPCSTVDSEKS